MFTLEMLPAARGDCLWIEYGDPAAPRVVLIDGGLAGTLPALQARIERAIGARPDGRLHMELCVVTHIDDDHILGVLALLKAADPRVSFGDIWFNGAAQLFPKDMLGVPAGQALSDLLEGEAAAGRLPWNTVADGAAVRIPPQGAPLSIELAGGLTLTVIGPPQNRLDTLAAHWRKLLTEGLKGADLDAALEAPPGRPDLLGKGDVWPPKWSDLVKHDTSKPNASSIALVAEYDGQAVLLTGDAWPEDLVAGIERLQASRGRAGRPLELAACKVSHHGSSGNISEELMRSLRCRDYLISTDGSVFSHPDHQAVLRLLRWGGPAPRLHFNYRVRTTADWGRDPDAVRLPGGALATYEAVYPAAEGDSLVFRVA